MAKHDTFLPRIRKIACSVLKCPSVNYRPRLTRCLVASHRVVAGPVVSPEAREVTRSLPLASVAVPLVQGLGKPGKLFRALPIGRHSPKCRPDSPETWRGKLGPTWAAIPNSLAHSLGRTWGAMGEPWKGEGWGSTVRAGLPGSQWDAGPVLQGRWECSSEYAYYSKVFLGTDHNLAD